MSTLKVAIPAFKLSRIGIKWSSAASRKTRQNVTDVQTLFQSYYKVLKTCHYSTNPVLYRSDCFKENSNTNYPYYIEFSEPMANELMSEDLAQTHAEGFFNSFTLCENFIDSVEESNLVDEVQPHLERQVYEKDHWDEAIVDFRETERKHWNHLNKETIQRLQKTAFEPEGTKLLPYVHVLDLAENGFIKPHIDSSRFCGDTVAVMSLLSDSVLKLVHENYDKYVVHVLVPRRSLYILRGISRYNYTHAILKKEESIFKGDAVLKERRISIVCRNEAKQ